MSPPFHVVLVEPLIPQNTGSVGRLCVATGARLHLVEPLGFDITEKAVRRAGLDYWKDVDLHVHPNLDTCLAAIGETRCWYLSSHATLPYTAAAFAPGDTFVFGKETTGLGAGILGGAPERSVTVPLMGPVRSLNLATTVGIVLYEGLRQTRPEQFLPPETP